MEEVLGKETVAKLIKETGLFFAENTDTYEVDGVQLPVHMVKPWVIDAMKTWQARHDDVFVVTYPKTGTTWSQEIASAICNNGDISKLRESHTWLRVPFIEAHMLTSSKDIQVPATHEIVDKMRSPRTIKSHLPGKLLPPDIMNKKSRIIYVARNPKDVAVSYFHFHNSVATLPTYQSWDAFLQDYLIGKVYCGPWWEHYLYFWKRRHEPNILFLTFEDMKRDLKRIVIKMAGFLGYNFSDDVIDQIVHHCTFSNMIKDPMSNPSTLINKVRRFNQEKLNLTTEEIEQEEKAAKPFMRKGKVGDWRDHFTVAQNEFMDKHIEEKLAGTGLTFEY